MRIPPSVAHEVGAAYAAARANDAFGASVAKARVALASAGDHVRAGALGAAAVDATSAATLLEGALTGAAPDVFRGATTRAADAATTLSTALDALLRGSTAGVQDALRGALALTTTSAGLAADAASTLRKDAQNLQAPYL